MEHDELLMGSINDDARVSFANRRRTRLIPRDRRTHFNLALIGASRQRCLAWISSPYHHLIDVRGVTLLLIILAFWLAIQLLFALLYFADAAVLLAPLPKINPRSPEAFAEALFFSVQTSSSIGYGTPLSPSSLYLNWVVVVHAFISMLQNAAVISLVLAKLTRPSKINRNLAYSDVGVIETSGQKEFQEGSGYQNGSYVDTEFPVFKVRFANFRKAQMLDTDMKLLLLCSSMDTWSLKEMAFELNQQQARAHSLDYSNPLLPLPFTISHVIDESSPLYEIPSDTTEQREVILVVDYIDEACSENVQGRYSWLWDSPEVLADATFSSMVSRSGGKYTVDLDNISAYERC